MSFMSSTRTVTVADPLREGEPKKERDVFKKDGNTKLGVEGGIASLYYFVFLLGSVPNHIFPYTTPILAVVHCSVVVLYQIEYLVYCDVWDGATGSQKNL